MFTAAGVSYD